MGLLCKCRSCRQGDRPHSHNCRLVNTFVFRRLGLILEALDFSEFQKYEESDYRAKNMEKARITARKYALQEIMFFLFQQIKVSVQLLLSHEKQSLTVLLHSVGSIKSI